MDSGNSGSMCSSGDEEYESVVHTVVPPTTFLNRPTQFGSISLQPQSHYLSFVSQSPHDHQTHNPSLLHPSPSYLHHPLSQSHPIAAAGASSSSSSSLLVPADQSLAKCNTDPSPQLRSAQPQHHNNGGVPGGTSSNAVRNPKKRSRASRRAPTTVLTTDTSNFRSMVQEFTGIPAPPFSPSSPYSRRLSSFVFNPHKHKLHPPNPSSLLSSSSTTTTTTNTHNLVDAIPSTTNNNPSTYNQLQQLPDLSMYNPHPTLFPFHSPLLQVQPSLQDLGMNHPPHFMTTTAGVSLSIPPPTHHHVMPLLTNQNGIGITVARGGAGAGLSTSTTATAGGTRDGLRAFDFEGTYGGKVAAAAATCKFNFAPSSSCSFNHDKALDINTTSNIRGEAGTVDSWICSSD